MADNKSDLPDNTSLRDGHERLLLMSLLMSQEARDDVLWRVQCHWFRVDAHTRIFKAIQKRNDSHLPIEPSLLAADLADTNELNLIGGLGAIDALAEDFLPSTVLHAGYYLKLVREQWIKRQAKYAAYEIAKLVEDDQPLSEIAAACEKTIGFVCETVAPQTAFDVKKTLIDAMPELERRMSGKALPGISVGFREVDQVLCGLRGGQVIVVAARPGVGKSAFALNAAMAMANDGKSVMFFSMEMSSLELMVRILSSESGTAANDINDGFKGMSLNDVEYQRDKILRAASRIQDLKLFIDDTPHQTMRGIAANAKRTKRKHGLDALFLDYLQLIEPEDKRMPREQQVATISRRTKVLAKELNVPIMLVAQVNRQNEKRDDKRPQLSDLRESGAIEADADVVGFLYRDEATPQYVDFVVRKNRSGNLHGGIKLGWIGSQTKFVEPEEILTDIGNYFGGKKTNEKTF